MSEVNKKEQETETPGRNVGVSDATRAWHTERGEEVAYVARWLRREEGRAVRIYEVVYRVDLLEKDDPMLLIKRVHEGEAQVAFVYAPGLLLGIGSLAGLLRSGRLKWRQDEYPSRKVVKLLKGSPGG